MIAHKMPQALLVLSHVQSAIRFVNFSFQFNPRQSLLRRLVGFQSQPKWAGASLSEMRAWERSCQQKSEAAGVAIGVFYHRKDISEH